MSDPYAIVKSKFRRHFLSYRDAFEGLKLALKEEFNFIIELVFMCFVVAAGLIFQISKNEWIIIIFCIGITLSAELMNTSIETLSQLKRFYKVIKKIKDLAAAAVLAVAIMDVVLGTIVFWPYVREFVGKVCG